MGKFDNNPNMLSDIKEMSYEQLDELADTIRKELIQDVSVVGGHLASNLGVVELTIALHRVFNTPEDKIIWDVGHQSYVHKYLTGRKDELKTLRQLDGLSGFPKICESEYDTYNSGHSGTSISACYGYARARDLQEGKYECIAVIGDGALTGGVAWEALSSAGISKTPMIVVLNDNAMSISGNVGGIARHLTKLRTSNAYNRFKDKIKKSGNTKFERRLAKVRDSIKYALLPGVIFEELGFKYYGPIDGHNIKALCEALEFSRDLERPVLLHVKTKKGKGFAPAEENPAKFHGIGAFDPETVSSETEINPKSWSEVFGNELCKLAAENEKIVAVSAAMVDGTGLKVFQNLYPERLFDVGIAEQNAVSFAAGLALNGLHPVVCLYSTFLQRAYDQVLSEVCLMNLPVVFGVDRAGITGRDGETHQGQFDIAFLRSIPNISLFSPKDEKSLCLMLSDALYSDSPVAIRYPRGNVPEKELPERYGTGKDVLIISDGIMLSEAISACNCLDKSGIKASSLYLGKLKPLDEASIITECSKYNYVVTLEDGCVTGGVGQEISALLSSSKLNIHVLNIGWPEKFIEHGSVSELRKRYKLDAESISIRVKDFIETKA